MKDGVYLRHRGLIFTLAYEMLGSVTDAEDVAHDVYERWMTVNEQIDSPRAYLARVTTNRCLDVLGSAQRRRLDYVGPWLPEPLPPHEDLTGPEETAVRHDAVSAAFLVILQTLGERERAGFVLREIFAFSYAEIAHMLGMNSDGARQMIRRARERVNERRQRFDVTPAHHNEVVKRFLDAVTAGEISALISTLSPDAVLIVDGGGLASAARRPIVGVDAIIRFLFGLRAKAGDTDTVHTDELNGVLGVVAMGGGTVDASFQFGVVGQTIGEIYVMRNPEKLRRLQPPQRGATDSGAVRS